MNEPSIKIFIRYRGEFGLWFADVEFYLGDKLKTINGVAGTSCRTAAANAVDAAMRAEHDFKRVQERRKR